MVDFLPWFLAVRLQIYCCRACVHVSFVTTLCSSLLRLALDVVVLISIGEVAVIYIKCIIMSAMWLLSLLWYKR